MLDCSRVLEYAKIRTVLQSNRHLFPSLPHSLRQKLSTTVGGHKNSSLSYGGVCLHFKRASFNTIFGKSNFKITLIFSKMTLYLNYIVYAVRYGLVKVFLYDSIRCSATRSGFPAKDHFWLGYLPRTFVALTSCTARYFVLYLDLVIELAIPLRLLRYDLYHFLQCGLCEKAHCHP